MLLLPPLWLQAYWSLSLTISLTSETDGLPSILLHLTASGMYHCIDKYYAMKVFINFTLSWRLHDRTHGERKTTEITKPPSVECCCRYCAFYCSTRHCLQCLCGVIAIFTQFTTKCCHSVLWTPTHTMWYQRRQVSRWIRRTSLALSWFLLTFSDSYWFRNVTKL